MIPRRLVLGGATLASIACGFGDSLDSPGDNRGTCRELTSVAERAYHEPTVTGRSPAEVVAPYLDLSPAQRQLADWFSSSRPTVTLRFQPIVDEPSLEYRVAPWAGSIPGCRDPWWLDVPIQVEVEVDEPALMAHGERWLHHVPREDGHGCSLSLSVPLADSGSGTAWFDIIEASEGFGRPVELRVVVVFDCEQQTGSLTVDYTAFLSTTRTDAWARFEFSE